MKKLLITLGVACLLTACGTADPNPPPSASKHDRPSPMSDWNNGWTSNKGPGICDSLSVFTIHVKGHDYLVSIKNPCDSSRYIFKGDPSPEMGNVWDERESVSREDILIAVEQMEHNNTIAP